MQTPRTTNRRINRTMTAVAGSIVVAVLLSACAGGDEPSDPGAADESPIVFGYTATLSGDFASYGLEMREGVDLAVEELNAAGGIDGRPVEIVSADDEGEPANGPVVAQQFCDDSSISAVLGYSFSSVALAALPVYTQCELPVLASAVTSPELSGASDFFSRNVYTDAYQGAAMGEFVFEQAATNVAVLYQQDDYGQGVAEAFTTAYEAAGGEVTSSQAYQLGTVEFATIVDTALADDPDAIFIGGFYTETAKIATQVRNAGSDVALFGTDGAVSSELFGLASGAAEGLTVYSAFDAGAATEASASFIEAFTAKYDKAPSSWAALAYDATQVTAQAIADGGSAERADVAQAIRSTSGYQGVTGEITIDQDGNRQGELLFLTVEDEAFVPVAQ